jgi:hypothetical protein
MQLSSQQQAPKKEKAKCPNMQLAEMGTRAKHKSVAGQNPKRPHTPTTNILTQQSKNLHSRTKNNTNTHTEAPAFEKQKPIKSSRLKPQNDKWKIMQPGKMAKNS